MERKYISDFSSVYFNVLFKYCLVQIYFFFDLKKKSKQIF
jgi:hypothetical protein